MVIHTVGHSNRSIEENFAEAEKRIAMFKEKGIPLMQALANTRGGLPFTIVIDAKGQVVQKKLGIMKRADLDAAAELALKTR